MKIDYENSNRLKEGKGPEGESVSVADVPNYELAFEIQCGATVGSAAVAAIPDGSGDIEIFVPSYELNKVSIISYLHSERSCVHVVVVCVL